jgi:hypothetical protein
LVFAKGSALLQKLIYQGGFPVVYVSNNGYVSYGAGFHGNFCEAAQVDTA